MTLVRILFACLTLTFFSNYAEGSAGKIAQNYMKKAVNGQNTVINIAKIVKSIAPHEPFTDAFIEKAKQEVNAGKLKVEDFVKVAGEQYRSKFFPKALQECINHLKSLNSAQLKQTLTRFANQETINENFTKTFNDFKLVKRENGTKLHAWLDHFNELLFGNNGKYKGSNAQKKRMLAFAKIVKVIEDLPHITNNARFNNRIINIPTLFDSIYADIQDQGDQFNLGASMKKALGSCQFDGQDICPQVIELVIGGHTIADAETTEKIRLRAAAYKDKYEIPQNTASQVAKAVIENGTGLEQALLAHLTPFVVDGENLTAKVARYMAQGLCSLGMAKQKATIDLRLKQLEDLDLDIPPIDCQIAAKLMAETGKSRKECLRIAFGDMILLKGDRVEGIITDILVANLLDQGQKYHMAYQKAKIQLRKESLEKLGIPTAVARRAAVHITNSRTNNGNQAYKEALRQHLGTLTYEGMELKDSVVDAIVEEDQKYPEALKTAKIKDFSRLYERIGLSSHQAETFAKDVVSQGTPKEDALKEVLQSIPYRYQNSGQAYELVDKIVQYIINDGLTLETAKQKAFWEQEIEILKTFNLGLQQTALENMAKAVIGDEARESALEAVIHPVKQRNQDLTFTIAMHMILYKANYTAAKKVVQSNFLYNSMNYSNPGLTKQQCKQWAQEIVVNNLSEKAALAEVIGSKMYKGIEFNKKIADLVIGTNPEDLGKISIKQALKKVCIKHSASVIKRDKPHLRAYADILAEKMFLENRSMKEALGLYLQAHPLFKGNQSKIDVAVDQILTHTKTIDSAWSDVIFKPISQSFDVKYSNICQYLRVAMTESCAMDETQKEATALYEILKKVYKRRFTVPEEIDFTPKDHLKLTANCMIQKNLSYKDADKVMSFAYAKTTLKIIGYEFLGEQPLNVITAQWFESGDEKIKPYVDKYILKLFPKINRNKFNRFKKALKKAKPTDLKAFQDDYLIKALIRKLKKKHTAEAFRQVVLKGMAEQIYRHNKNPLDALSKTLEDILMMKHQDVSRSKSIATIMLNSNFEGTLSQAIQEDQINQKTTELKTKYAHLSEENCKLIAHEIITKSIGQFNFNVKNALMNIFLGRAYSAPEAVQIADAVLVKGKTFDEAEEEFGCKLLKHIQKKYKNFTKEETKAIAKVMKAKHFSEVSIDSAILIYLQELPEIENSNDNQAQNNNNNQAHAAQIEFDETHAELVLKTIKTRSESLQSAVDYVKLVMKLREKYPALALEDADKMVAVAFNRNALTEDEVIKAYFKKKLGGKAACYTDVAFRYFQHLKKNNKPLNLETCLKKATWVYSQVTYILPTNLLFKNILNNNDESMRQLIKGNKSSLTDEEKTNFLFNVARNALYRKEDVLLGLADYMKQEGVTPSDKFIKAHDKFKDKYLYHLVECMVNKNNWGFSKPCSLDDAVSKILNKVIINENNFNNMFKQILGKQNCLLYEQVYGQLESYINPIYGFEKRALGKSHPIVALCIIDGWKPNSQDINYHKSVFRWALKEYLLVKKNSFSEEIKEKINEITGTDDFSSQLCPAIMEDVANDIIRLNGNDFVTAVATITNNIKQKANEKYGIKYGFVPENDRIRIYLADTKCQKDVRRDVFVKVLKKVDNLQIYLPNLYDRLYKNDWIQSIVNDLLKKEGNFRSIEEICNSYKTVLDKKAKEYFKNYNISEKDVKILVNKNFISGGNLVECLSRCYLGRTTKYGAIRKGDHILAGSLATHVVRSVNAKKPISLEEAHKLQISSSIKQIYLSELKLINSYKESISRKQSLVEAHLKNKTDEEIKKQLINILHNDLALGFVLINSKPFINLVYDEGMALYGAALYVSVEKEKQKNMNWKTQFFTDSSNDWKEEDFELALTWKTFSEQDSEIVKVDPKLIPALNALKKKIDIKVSGYEGATDQFELLIALHDYAVEKKGKQIDPQNLDDDVIDDKFKKQLKRYEVKDYLYQYILGTDKYKIGVSNHTVTDQSLMTCAKLICENDLVEDVKDSLEVAVKLYRRANTLIPNMIIEEEAKHKQKIDKIIVGKKYEIKKYRQNLTIYLGNNDPRNKIFYDAIETAIQESEKNQKNIIIQWQEKQKRFLQCGQKDQLEKQRLFFNHDNLICPFLKIPEVDKMEDVSHQEYNRILTTLLNFARDEGGARFPKVKSFYANVYLDCSGTLKRFLKWGYNFFGDGSIDSPLTSEEQKLWRKRIKRVFNKLLDPQKYKKQDILAMLYQVHSNVHACVDASRQALTSLESAICEDKLNFHQKLAHCLAGLRMKILEKIAYNFNNGGEMVETRIFLNIACKKQLSIPCLQEEMSHGGCSRITGENIKTVVKLLIAEYKENMIWHVSKNIHVDGTEPSPTQMTAKELVEWAMTTKKYANTLKSELEEKVATKVGQTELIKHALVYNKYLLEEKFKEN